MSSCFRNGIIVGLYWTDINKSGFDEDVLEDMIHDGEIDCGSYQYDSGYHDNVIGFWVVEPTSVEELDMDVISRNIEKQTKKFRELFSNEPKVYLTPFVF